MRTIGIGLLAALLAAASAAQDGAEEIAMLQEKSREATGLTEHHEALGDFVGRWDVTISLVMPGVPEQSWQGTAEVRWLIEGRWLLEELEGELFGRPYQSAYIRGFDTYAKNHVVATVSSADTSLLVGRAPVVDPTGEIVAFYGTLDEYTTDELNKPFRSVIRRIDADRHVLEVWDLAIGAEGAKVLQFSYSRRRP